LSSFEFNPITGAFDLVGKSDRYKKTQAVDASFLSTPDIVLQKEPKLDSEVVSLNGLEIDDSNYSISGDTLTMVTTQLLAGDVIYINFIG